MKIFGIAKNYSEHIAEMEMKAPSPSLPTSRDVSDMAEPVVFTKCDSALVNRGRPFFIPDFTNECEYETELVVRISRMGRSIANALPTAITMPSPWALTLLPAISSAGCVRKGFRGTLPKALTEVQS